MKPVLIYDRVNSWGGAEKVLLALHQLYPQAPLYTSVYDPATAVWAQDWEIHTSWLQRLPWARRHHRVFGWLMPWLFAGFDLSAFDLIIAVTSEAAKNVRIQPNQLFICYLLTPTRYLWSHSRDYWRELPVWLRPLARVVFAWLRRQDYQAAQRPDVIVPISQRVGQRAQRYYRRWVAPPIYPPIQSLGQAKAPTYQPTQKFIISWGRHVPYKQFDAVIRAAVMTSTPLILAGAGPDTPRLRALAQRLDPSQHLIHLVGQLSDGELQWYLQQAMGAVFPQEEDFGLVIMEAQLAGCPVIINSRSGAAELVIPGQTALLLPSTKLSDLAKTIRQLSRRSWLRLDIARHARQYAGAHFARSWQRQERGMIKGNHD